MKRKYTDIQHRMIEYIRKCLVNQRVQRKMGRLIQADRNNMVNQNNYSLLPWQADKNLRKLQMPNLEVDGQQQ